MPRYKGVGMPRAKKRKAEATQAATSDEEAEPAEDYAPGGYHPVALGDVYDERYEVQHKLGWGVYSTVWCCRDRRSRRRVLEKVARSPATLALSGRARARPHRHPAARGSMAT